MLQMGAPLLDHPHKHEGAAGRLPDSEQKYITHGKISLRFCIFALNPGGARTTPHPYEDGQEGGRPKRAKSNIKPVA